MRLKFLGVPGFNAGGMHHSKIVELIGYFVLSVSSVIRLMTTLSIWPVKGK